MQCIINLAPDCMIRGIVYDRFNVGLRMCSNVHDYSVYTSVHVDKEWGLKQIETDSSQSELSVHTTEFNLV